MNFYWGLILSLKFSPKLLQLHIPMVLSTLSTFFPHFHNEITFLERSHMTIS